MKHSNQQEPLVVQQLEIDQRTTVIHTHHYFDLILIRRGSGQHFVNGNLLMYQEGDLFFLGPLDNHYFFVEKKTQFSCLSFTELYMAALTTDVTSTWPKIMGHGLQKWQPMMGSIETDRTEKQNLQVLMDIILAEQTNVNQLASRLIINSLMQTILSLVDRKLDMCPLSPSSSPSSLLQRIVAYISLHITEPGRLRIENLSDLFHYSPSHLSALFKRQAGESIQQYIIRYRLRMVETRLGYDTMSISQIADEFGFTDVCHLNKLFKQYYHQTPTNYRHQLTITRNSHLRTLA